MRFQFIANFICRIMLICSVDIENVPSLTGKFTYSHNINTKTCCSKIWLSIRYARIVKHCLVIIF